MLKPILALFTGTALGQAITIAASPIITRLFDPDEFGALGVFSSYLAILTLVACLRFELAITLPKSDRDAWRIVTLCIGISFLLSLVLHLVLLIGGEPLAELVGAKVLANYLWLLPVGLLLGGAYQTFSQVALRFRAYKPVAKTKVIQALLGASTQILGGVSGVGLSALLVGQIVSAGAGVIQLAKLSYDHGFTRSDMNRIGKIKEVASRYKSFAWLGSPAALLNGLALNLPTIIIASMYDAATAGQFFLAQRILNMPISMLGSAVSQSFMGEASALHRKDDKAIYTLFWRTTKAAAAFSLLLSVGIYFLSEPLFPILFGDAWNLSGSFASLLSIYLGFRFLSSSLSPTLIIYERQDISLLLQIIALSATAAAYWIATINNYDPLQTVKVYSLLMISPYAVGIIFIFQTIAWKQKTSHANRKE